MERGEHVWRQAKEDGSASREWATNGNNMGAVKARCFTSLRHTGAKANVECLDEYFMKYVHMESASSFNGLPVCECTWEAVRL